MNRDRLLICCVALLAILVLWQWERTNTTSPEPVVDAGADMTRNHEGVDASKAPGDERVNEAGTESTNRFGLPDEELARLKRRYEFERAAERRFHQTADADGLTPDSVRPEVRTLFSTLRLEPEYDLREGQQGYVDGMRVARMESGNPLAKAGFRVGDRLTRINGEALRDPAVIAHLMTRLGTTMEVCASRSGNLICRQITL